MQYHHFIDIHLRKNFIEICMRKLQHFLSTFNKLFADKQSREINTIQIT